MKKLIMTAAVVACAGIVSAQVYSDNIVGYEKTATPAAGEFKIITVTQLSPTGGDSVDIQDAIANMDQLTASTTFANADKLLIYDGGYTEYGLYDNGGSVFWMIDGSSWTFPLYFPPAPSTLSLPRGGSVWFKAGTGSTSTEVLVTGEAYMDATFQVAVDETFTLVSYPFSSTINLTDLVIANATASTTYANADKIIVYDNGYTEYGLYDAGGGNSFWMVDGSSWTFPLYFPPAPTSLDIDLGNGFWFKTDGFPKTIGFDTNY